MNRDDIIRMARESELCYVGSFNPESKIVIPAIERFAALVAAAEREACAEVAEAHANNIHGYDKHDYANAIRERGE